MPAALEGPGAGTEPGQWKPDLAHDRGLQPSMRPDRRWAGRSRDHRVLDSGRLVLDEVAGICVVAGHCTALILPGPLAARGFGLPKLIGMHSFQDLPGYRQRRKSNLQTGYRSLGGMLCLAVRAT